MLRLSRFLRTAEADPRHGHAQLPSYHPQGFGKRNVLHLLHEAENVSRSSAAKAVIKLSRGVYRKRRRFLGMKGTQPGVVLRPCLPQPDIVPHHAHDVRLLLESLFE